MKDEEKTDATASNKGSTLWKIVKRLFLFICILFGLFFAVAIPLTENRLGDDDTGIVSGLQNNEIAQYTNGETGYQIAILDNAELLSEAEEASLLQDMIPATAFCNAVFYSTTDAGGFNTTADLAYDAYKQTIGDNVNGTLFCVDMEHRVIYFNNGGKIKSIITPDKSDSITDNTFRFASNGEWYRCSSTAFAQAVQVLSGRLIPQPMKHISNFLFALTIAFFICYRFMAKSVLSPKKKSASAQSPAGTQIESIGDFQVILGKRTERRIEHSSSSSSSSGGGYRSSGGGGGGSGGGHRF